MISRLIAQFIKSEWIIQVYDRKGQTCGKPYRFKGTQNQLREHMREEYGETLDEYGRFAMCYNTRDYTEDTILKEIPLEKKDAE